MLGEIVTAILLSQGATAPSCRTADHRVEDVIVARQRELRGQEICQYRLYETLSDVDGDRVADFLVVFTIEGVEGSANNSIQFLALFTSRAAWRPVVVEVARRGKRVVRSIHAVVGVVDLGTLEYAPPDPMCCPSRTGSLRVVLRDGKISVSGE